MLCLQLCQNVGKAPTTLPQTPPQVLAPNSLHTTTSKCASSKSYAILVLLLPILSTNSHSLLLVRTGIGRTPSLGCHLKSTKARVEIFTQRHLCAKQCCKLGFSSSMLCQRHNFWIEEWMAKWVPLALFIKKIPRCPCGPSLTFPTNFAPMRVSTTCGS